MGDVIAALLWFGLMAFCAYLLLWSCGVA